MFKLPFDTLKVTFLQRYQTNGLTDSRSDGQTDGPTTRLLELLRQLKKNYDKKIQDKKKIFVTEFFLLTTVTTVTIVTTVITVTTVR